ncbi:MAG: MmcQ/YjbR family DNA-binding protein [Firmicutes bacterium]|nr:MmcQ/YjbR family DNA-binding protein [Bacillota bacterium]
MAKLDKLDKTTRQQLIDFCLTFLNTYEDYPFHDINEVGAWAAIRHKQNKKSFAFIYMKNDDLCINVKCEPFEADFLRQTFKDVLPAYHMNKTHWNTITINGDVPTEELKNMITASYNLTKPKVKKLKRAE